MEVSPSELDRKQNYKLITGAIIPRPIGWISTVNADGQPNLAPFSYFAPVSSNPPHVIFSPGIRGTDGAVKDTLVNVRENGEFVVNIVTESLLDAMNLTSTEFPAEVDEFSAAGLTAEPSRVVAPPRVGESPVHFECRVVQIVDVGEPMTPGSGSVVIGEVVHIHVDESVMLGDYKIDLLKLKPVGRLAGSVYCRVTDTLDLPRPSSQVKK